MKLYTYGCSNTYGHYLDDRERNNWPWHLSQMLGLNVDNRGVCGASNDRILRELLETEFDDDALVVMLWTYQSRAEIVGEDGFCNMIPSDSDGFAKRYYTYIQNDNYDDWRLCNNIHHAECYLKSKGIPYVMAFVSDDITNSTYTELFKQSLDRASFFTDEDKLLQTLKKRYPSLKDGHPSSEAYYDFAEYLYEWMSNKERYAIKK